MLKYSLIPAAFFFVLAGCQNKKETQSVAAAEAPPVPASVMTVKSEPFTATVAVTGTLVSRARVDVKAETTGRVLKFPKYEGDRVEAGEAVIWVDDVNYQLAVRQAETAVQVAEASVERAKVQQSYSETELERARNLIKSGGITEKDLTAAEVAERDAKAQVALAGAQLDQTKAALDVARKRLHDTIVRAPVSGEIQHRFVNPGAYVEPSTPVFTVVDNARLELESPVATVDLGQVRSGQRVSFTVNAYPGTTFEGRIIEVNPAVDAETRSATLRIQVDNSSRRLKAGMFAQGDILTGVTAQAIIIPAAAVYRDDRSATSAYVLLAENGKAVRRPVVIGREKDSQLEIVQGLKPGDVVITEQRIELADGVRVAPGK